MSDQKYIILDRDGVINVDLFDYVTKPADFKFEDGSLDALSILSNNNFKIVSKKKPTKSQIKDLIFAFNICKQALFFSIKVHVLAPREIASTPRAPVPAKISRTRVCSILKSNFPPKSMLNKLSLIRSVVGRRVPMFPSALIVLKRLPFKVPPITLIELKDLLDLFLDLVTLICWVIFLFLGNVCPPYKPDYH